MSETSERLEKLGIKLPVRNRKGQGVVDAVIDDDMMYLSLALPVDADGNSLYTGKVGTDLSVEEGYQAARTCAINALTTIKDYVGELDRVDHIVEVFGMVNCGADFSSQPAVINGFSDVMVEVFGRRGQHARMAVGAYALPHNVPVGVKMIVKLRK